VRETQQRLIAHGWILITVGVVLAGAAILFFVFFGGRSATAICRVRKKLNKNDRRAKPGKKEKDKHGKAKAEK
jgi:hypothetical protein